MKILKFIKNTFICIATIPIAILGAGAFVFGFVLFLI